MKKIIDDMFVIAYMMFGLFLILVGVKDSAIYLWESIGLILIGGGLVVCSTNQLINLMNEEV
jgi:hypothetical protein